MQELALWNVAMKSSRQMHVILKALAEPRRVAILTLVRSRHELRAGEIARHFRSTRPGISQHLRVLTNAGLLCERRQGTSRLYSLRREGFGDFGGQFLGGELIAIEAGSGKRSPERA